MGARRKCGPGQRAWTRRGAEPGAAAEPAVHGALLQGRGAGGRAELAAAGRPPGVSLPHLESQGLSRAAAVSSGVFLRFGGRASSPFRLCRCPGEDGSARSGRQPGGEETARGLRGSSALRPLSCLQMALGTRKTSILSLSPPSRLPFFPVLQILGSSSSGNAGRKLAREGGGGWKFLAAPRCVCMGPEEVGGWVEEHGVGGRTRSSESWSAALEITGQLGRKPPRSQEDPQPQPPASCPTTASEEGRRRRAGLGTEGARWNWKKSCLALILVVTVSLTLSILVPAFSYTNA